MGKKIALIVCIAILAGLIYGAYVMMPEEQIEDAGTIQTGALKLTYKGTEYPMKQHLQTVLLIGTDSTEQYEEKTEGLKSFYNYNQADFLMLIVQDTAANTAQIIQLNRDTMTDVPWLDVLGNFGGTEYKQLCLAYNYGDGGVKSCRNTTDAVSRLLFDAPVQNYIQVPMSAIPVLNDLVGGVPVTMSEDLTAIDPAFVKGATVQLTGAQAERFVRARMELEDDTNLARMRRQRQYLDSFQKCARKAINTDSQFVVKLLEKLGEYLQSDLTGQQLSDLITRLDHSEVSDIRSPEGKLVLGEEHYEFYVDEGSLWELVKSVYCE